MPKLHTLALRSLNPVAQRRFYQRVMDMSPQASGGLGYSDREMRLIFTQAETPYCPQPSDLYWKIAVSVPNIELAYRQLVSRGAQVSEPHQFRDVGYLAHITDPEGFTVELIEHWFQGDRPSRSVDETLLGGGPHISLLTLRTADIARVEPDLLKLGMRPLGVQPVEPYGFTLYFYGFTRETPPQPDLSAIENRTWLYRRPYTVLEIQHVHELDAETHPLKQAGGFAGATVHPSASAIHVEGLKLSSA
jgi:predicted enzyme related to lactoylglutathione lyase